MTTEHILPGTWGPSDRDLADGRLFVTTGHGVTIRRFSHGPYRLDRMPGCVDHLMAIRLSGRCMVDRVMDGRETASVTSPGSVTLVPAGSESSWSVRGRGELLYLFVPQPLLERLALEDEHGSAFRLSAVLGVVDPFLRLRAEELVQELQDGALPESLLIEAVTIQLLTWVIRRHIAISTRTILSRLVHPFNRSVARRLAEYLRGEAGRTVSFDAAATLARCSRSHFTHRFKATFGLSPQRYLIAQRVERARLLLQDTDLSVADIALSCGFAHQAHLVTLFKRETGTTPGLYRRRIKAG